MSDLGILVNARECFRRARTELIMAANEFKRTNMFVSTIKEIEDTVYDIDRSMDALTNILNNLTHIPEIENDTTNR